MKDDFVKVYSKLCSLFEKSGDFFEIAAENLADISDLLYIADISVSYVPDKKFAAVRRERHNYTIYSAPNAAASELDPVSIQTHTPHLGIAVYTARRKNSKTTWNDDERMKVNLVLQTVHLFCSRKYLAENLDSLAQTDLRTGLLNADSFAEYIKKVFADDMPENWSGCFLNVRNMKEYNRKYGVEAGDRVIDTYAAALRNFCEGKELVCRYNGDLFAILIKKDKKEMWKKRILSVPVTVNDENGEPKQFIASAYMGFSDYSAEDEKHGDLIFRAHTAYKYAKYIQNTDSVDYSPSIDSVVMHRKFVLTEYKNAMKDGSLTVYYQPKTDLKTYKLNGAEALSRWIYKGEVKSPFLYVPILESTSAICDLDFYNFRNVCKQIRKWIDDGITPVRISVNFSRKHLTNQHLADQIEDIINEYNIPKKYIEIEITETTDASEYGSLLKFISDLREKHITVSVDDFGTGFSSLNILKDIPVDIIKLDKSMLSDTEFRDRMSTVLSDLVKMARDLNISTVCEGVETREQADFLESIDCNTAQGYYFNKPLPEKDFTKRLKIGYYDKVKA